MQLAKERRFLSACNEQVFAGPCCAFKRRDIAPTEFAAYGQRLIAVERLGNRCTIYLHGAIAIAQ